jgi:hypothetical protein
MNCKTMNCQRFLKSRLNGSSSLLILLACLSGCGDTAKVTGRVTYQGRPLCCGTVVFLSANKKARSSVIDSDGTYVVDGVPAGTTKVGVISRDRSTGRFIVRDGKRIHPDKIAGWFALPRRFESPDTSGLAYTIVPGHVSQDIELK